MTTNIDRAAEIIYRVLNPRFGDFGGHGETADALANAGLLAPDLPEPIINADDDNPEWHADEHTVDVDRGMVGLWTTDGTGWGKPPNQARNLALSLLAAADYAEGVGRADA